MSEDELFIALVLAAVASGDRYPLITAGKLLEEIIELRGKK